jgi:hypothetical protein
VRQLITNDAGFDFEVGHWNSKVRRLAAPLSGSDEWLTYEGTTGVTPLWKGAYAVELDVSGHAGHLHFFSLRFFDKAANEWVLRTGVPGSGDLDPPLRGRFKQGVGEFNGLDTFKGRSVMVRLVVRKPSDGPAVFEQYFSVDNGKTFELNLVTEDERA